MSTSVSEGPVAANVPQLRLRRQPLRYGRGWAVAHVVLDLAMFLLASYLAAAVLIHRWDPLSYEQLFWHSTIYYITIWLVIFHWLGLYRLSFAFSVKDEIYYTVTALTLGIVPQLALFTFLPTLEASRLLLVVSLAFAIVLVGGGRVGARAVMMLVDRNRPRRTAIIGSEASIAVVERSLDRAERTTLHRIVVDDLAAPDGSADAQRPSWFGQALDRGCDSILLTDMLPPHVLPYVLEDAARQRIKVAFAPPRICCHGYSLHLERDGQQALIVPSRLSACTPPARLIKRIMDLSIAWCAIICLSPFMLVAALAVLVDSGTPVFYRQRRIGRNGEIFNILKFRSMRHDPIADDTARWATHGDNRVTRAGAILRRTSLDELPQLFNVIKGEMSMVGPRPEMVEYAALFCERFPHYDERHLVRPGITGFAQVNMKRVLEPNDVEHVLSHDLFYVEHWSPFLDLSILLKTAAEFLFHRAA